MTAVMAAGMMCCESQKKRGLGMGTCMGTVKAHGALLGARLVLAA